MKKCKKCLEVKDSVEFYPHPRMADGHLSFCKTCVRARIRVHRQDNQERIREYDRNRPNAVLRSKETKARHVRQMCDPVYRKRYLEVCRVSRERHRVEKAANTIVRTAIKGGRLFAPKLCEGCGKETKLHAHHEDYAAPLVVKWLCIPCHAMRHKELNAIKRCRSDGIRS